MPDTRIMDSAYNFIIKRLVDTGQAPHYSELANHLSLGIDDGRNVLHDLVESSGAVRLQSEAELIDAVPPFSSIPTQYRISVDGQQQWFGQ